MTTPHENITPFPALPPHLNPFFVDGASPSPKRRFPTSKYKPSPLRKTYVPDTDEAVPQVPTAFPQPSTADVTLPLEPPGLAPPIPKIIPLEVRQAIEYGRKSAEISFKYYRKNSFTKHMKDVAICNSRTCLDYIHAYGENLIEDIKDGNVDVELAHTQWKLIMVEFKMLTDQLRSIKALPYTP